MMDPSDVVSASSAVLGLCTHPLVLRIFPPGSTWDALAEYYYAPFEDNDMGDFTVTHHFFLKYRSVIEMHDYSNLEAIQALIPGVGLKFISFFPLPLIAQGQAIIAQLQISLSVTKLGG